MELVESRRFLPVPEFEYIRTVGEATEALEYFSSLSEFEVDTEGTGLDPYTSKVVLLQFGGEGRVCVFDVRKDIHKSEIDLTFFKDILTNKSIKKLLQNASYDMKMIKVNGGYYIENIYDTMIAEQLLISGITFKSNLQLMVKKYLGLEMDKEPRGTFEKYDQEFEQYQLEYAAKDVTILTMLRDMQEGELKKHGFEHVVQLEFDFVKALSIMEVGGITIDVVKWRELMFDIGKEQEGYEKTLHGILSTKADQTTLFGVSKVNINSNKQLLVELNKFGFNLESTGVEELEKYEGHPVIDTLLNYRKTQKLLSTYGEPLLERISPITGRLHTQFKQMVPNGGRLSSNNPNLQNIPKLIRYRNKFIAKEGCVLITADQSAAELRCLANMSQDAGFVDGFLSGKDLHALAASRIFNVDYDKVTHDQRQASKAISFGLCVAEGTSVTTGDGIKYIKDVNIGDDISNDIDYNRVIDKKFMGEKECYKITTKYGYTLECTKDHLVKVINSDGEYVDKKLKDIDISKDCVCLKKGSNLFKKDPYYFNFIFNKENYNCKEVGIPEQMTTEFACFLGWFISEGSIYFNEGNDYNLTIAISKKDQDSIDSIFKVFFYLVKERLKVYYYEDMVIFKVYSKEFIYFIKSLFNNMVNKTTDIHIPECILQSEKICQIYFLQSLFEGDGTVCNKGNKYTINYYTMSKVLIKQLQLMLLNFNILSSIIKINDKRYPERNYYQLSIIGEDSKDKFISTIGFLSNRKKSVFKNKVLTYNKSVFYLPNQKNLLKALKGINSDISYRVKHSNFNITQHNLNNIQKVCNNDFINFILNNNIIPLPIVSIESVGVKKVYDISVDKHPYFLANGFIVHNCYGLSKYGLSTRLKISEKEAEKLMKSYFDAYPGVKNFLEQSAKIAVKFGFSRSIAGRKRFYSVPPMSSPEYKHIIRGIERQAKNSVIQNSNADVIKKAMIYVVEELEKLPYYSELLLTVHDELICEVEYEHRYEVAKIVEDCILKGFADYFTLVPMETQALIGPCWLKEKCENPVDGKKCGGIEFEFRGNDLTCIKCGNIIK